MTITVAKSYAPLLFGFPICVAWFVIGLVIVILLRARAPQILAQSDRIYVEGEEV